MDDQFVEAVVIKNNGDRVSVSWQWGRAGSAAVDIYARRWDVDPSQGYGVFLQRENKLPGYALADVEVGRAVIAGGIYHFTFLPVVGDHIYTEYAMTVENIRVGRHPEIQYKVSDSRISGMVQISFAVEANMIPAGHLQVVSRASQVVYPLMKDIKDKSSFLMFGERKSDVEVEAKGCYKECYHISRR